MMERLEHALGGKRLWILLGAASAVWIAFTATMTVLPYRLNFSRSTILEFFPRCITTWTNA